MPIDRERGAAVPFQAEAAIGRLAQAWDVLRAEAPASGFVSGAALALWQDGRQLLSLQCGEASPGRPWTADTPCLIWSASKGIAAACTLHALAERGIPLDAPMAAVWPEFEAAGKGRTTLADVLSHRAGLAALDTRGLAITDHAAVASALAAQRRNWPADGTHGYGARTFGFLLDEIVRRMTGEPLAAHWERIFREPLDLDLWFGIPPDRADTAAIVVAPRAPPPPGPFAQAFADTASLTRRALSEPGGVLGASAMNTLAMRTASVPSLGAIATADAVARFYSLLAAAPSSVLPEAAMAAMRTTLSRGPDRVLREDTAFSAGFMTNDHGVFGPSPTAFGHPGAGGAIGFADPAAGLGFAFIPGAMHPGALPGDRTRRLVAALYGMRTPPREAP